MTTTQYAEATAAELDDFAAYFTDAYRGRKATDRVNREADLAELHEVALELHVRREAAAEAAAARVLDARLALIKPWSPITVGGDRGQTGTIIIERDADTRRVLKAKTWLWQPGENVGPSLGRWADLLTEHWFLPAPARTTEHMRTVDARALGGWLDDGTYLKGGPLYTAAIEELYDRAVFEAEARAASDDPWTQGALAAAGEWNRPWPGESA